MKLVNFMGGEREIVAVFWDPRFGLVVIELVGGVLVQHTLDVDGPDAERIVDEMEANGYEIAWPDDRSN